MVLPGFEGDFDGIRTVHARQIYILTGLGENPGSSCGG